MKRPLIGIALSVVAFTFLGSLPASAVCPRSDFGSVIITEIREFEAFSNHLVSVRPDGSKYTVFPGDDLMESPDISPDGRTVVFEHCPNQCFGDDVDLNIAVMSVSGGAKRLLTDCDGVKCLYSRGPSYSTDGRSIVFTQTRQSASGVAYDGIYIMKPNGTNVRRVLKATAGSGLVGPKFSPDGRRIVFVRELAGRTQLMVVGSNGTGLRQLLPGTPAHAPSWSPDGSEIAFTLYSATTSNIAAVRPDGTHLRMITREPAGRSAASPDYSPSGRRLVFGEQLSDGGELTCRLVTTNVVGRDLQVVAENPIYCGFTSPSWGPGRLW